MSDQELAEDVHVALERLITAMKTANSAGLNATFCFHRPANQLLQAEIHYWNASMLQNFASISITRDISRKPRGG